MGLIMAISASAAMAGADGPIEPAPVYDEVLNQISLREAEMLFEEGVQFYDANELEIWAQGYIPGAIFFNVKDWKKLLPEDKSTTLVFYCVNPLCTSSEMAAREVMKLGIRMFVRCPRASSAGVVQTGRSSFRKMRASPQGGTVIHTDIQLRKLCLP